MPDAAAIAHATLQEVTWTNGLWQTVDEAFEVPFNPQSIKVDYTNQKAPSGPGSGSNAVQYVGSGTTKLTLDLLFDVTVPPATGVAARDVRELTKKVRRFVQPGGSGETATPAGDDATAASLLAVPALRFLWGSFLFDGVVDQIGETLTLFSADGRALRATVALAMSSAEIDVDAEVGPSGSGAGTTPQTPAPAGAPLQKIAAGADWKAIAGANDIENPRLIPPGTLLDLNPPPATVGVRP